MSNIPLTKFSKCAYAEAAVDARTCEDNRKLFLKSATADIIILVLDDGSKAIEILLHTWYDICHLCLHSSRLLVGDGIELVTTTSEPSTSTLKLRSEGLSVNRLVEACDLLSDSIFRCRMMLQLVFLHSDQAINEFKFNVTLWDKPRFSGAPTLHGIISTETGVSSVTKLIKTAEMQSSFLCQDQDCKTPRPHADYAVNEVIYFRQGGNEFMRLQPSSQKVFCLSGDQLMTLNLNRDDIKSSPPHILYRIETRNLTGSVTFIIPCHMNPLIHLTYLQVTFTHSTPQTSFPTYAVVISLLAGLLCLLFMALMLIRKRKAQHSTGRGVVEISMTEQMMSQDESGETDSKDATRLNGLYQEPQGILAQTVLPFKDSSLGTYNLSRDSVTEWNQKPPEPIAHVSGISFK
jgi:hypothetical protein